jgi:hypothetical protein
VPQSSQGVIEIEPVAVKLAASLALAVTATTFVFKTF